MPKFCTYHHLATVYIVVCTAVCAVMFWLTPYNHDDLYYRMPFCVTQPADVGVNDEADSPDAGEIAVRMPSMPEFVSFFADHYLQKNGRTGDKLLTLALLLPKALFVLLTGFAVFAILNCTFFISNRLRGPTARIICASLMILCLPWYDLMFTGAFAVNYLWGGALALICFSFMSGRFAPRRKTAKFAVCLLMVFGGSWHEGYAMTVAGAIFVYLCCKRFKVSRIQIVWCVLWLIGAAVVMLSPSSWDRLETTGSPISWSRMFSIETLAYMNITLFYLPLVLVSFLYKKTRHRIDADTRALLIAIAVMLPINMYIVGRTYWVSRIAMFSMIFTLPAMVLLLRTLMPSRQGRGMLFVKRAATTVLSAAVAINLSASLYWQIKIYNQFHEILKEYRSRKTDGTIYYDLITENTLPWYTLWKPSGYILHNAWGLTTVSQYYGRTPLYILPLALKSVNPSVEGKLLESGTTFKLRDVNGFLIAENFPEGRTRKVLCRTADNKRQWIYVMVTPLTGADGRQYSYLEPVYKLSDSHAAIVAIPKYKKDKK